MERVELGSLAHTVERAWVADVVQGRQSVIRVGRLADGRWWAERCDGRRSVVFACDHEVQAEAVADRWSRRSGLRWRRAETDPVLP